MSRKRGRRKFKKSSRKGYGKAMAARGGRRL